MILTSEGDLNVLPSPECCLGSLQGSESRIEAVDNDFEFRNHNHDDCTQFIS